MSHIPSQPDISALPIDAPATIYFITPNGVAYTRLLSSSPSPDEMLIMTPPPKPPIEVVEVADSDDEGGKAGDVGRKSRETSILSSGSQTPYTPSELGSTFDIDEQYFEEDNDKRSVSAEPLLEIDFDDEPLTTPVASSSAASAGKRPSALNKGRSSVKRRKTTATQRPPGSGRFVSGSFSTMEDWEIYQSRRPDMRGSGWSGVAQLLNRKEQACADRHRILEKKIKEIILSGKL